MSYAHIASVLLDRTTKYKGPPAFTQSWYDQVIDSGSNTMFAELNLLQQGLSQQIIGTRDPATGLRIMVELTSSTSTPYTAANIPNMSMKGGGCALLVDRTITMAGDFTSANDPTVNTWTSWINMALDNTEQDLEEGNSKFQFLLDKSTSITPTLVAGATGSGVYAGVGGPQTVNDSQTTRQYWFAEQAVFNPATNGIRFEAFIRLCDLDPAFRDLPEVMLGLGGITQLIVWYNTMAQSIQPFISTDGAPAPRISIVPGNTALVYRRYTASAHFETQLMKHLSERAEKTHSYLETKVLPSLTNYTGSNISNINLGSFPNLRRLLVVISPSGAATSNTSTFPCAQSVGLTDVMVRVGGDQCFQRPLGLQNAFGQVAHYELYRTTMDASLIEQDEQANEGDALLSYEAWRRCNRVHAFDLSQMKDLSNGDAIFFSARLIADLSQNITIGSTPLDILFFAQSDKWYKSGYRKQNGQLWPYWRPV